MPLGEIENHFHYMVGIIFVKAADLKGRIEGRLADFKKPAY